MHRAASLAPSCRTERRDGLLGVHMRIVRSALVAAAAVVALAPVLAGVADAQVPYVASIDAVCNTTTGEYDVTATLNSNLGVDTDITDATYSVDGGPAVDSTFDPQTLPADGSSSLTVSVPGDATSVEVGFFVTEVDSFDSIGTELAGDCVATVATTAAPTTTTTAVAVPAPPAAAAPAFTG
jgi:hypothetical protein